MSEGQRPDPAALPGLDQLGLRSLLSELVERVESVTSLADRLQGLLQAVVAIGSNLELDDVLHRIVRTAADLLDAKYAALGVLDPSSQDRRLAQFVTVGIDPSEVSRIGDLPHGRGLLGLLIDEPKAIRLDNIADHRASYGFPPNHPPMSTFLGVPITVRGEAFGNLYLTEKRDGGSFTEADEQIALALAAAAGLAVQNAHLYDQARRRQGWLEATSSITTKLLAGADVTEVFPLIVSCARELGDANVAFLAFPNSDGTMRVEAADGAPASALLGRTIPATSMAAHVMDTGRSESFADARQEPRVWQEVIDAAVAGPALFVPLGEAGSSLGTLVVANRVGAAELPPDTRRLVETFAAQAGLALRLGAAAQDREQLAVFGDRDRIARDLHDLVIQRLFATGMALESALRTVQPESAAERVQRCVDDLDTTIKEIRTTIFALQAPAPGAGEGLRAAVTQAVHQAAGTLGFEPRLILSGPVDTLVPPAMGEQLLAVLREALSNAARHAEASAVEVEITAAPAEVSLIVRDDGIGLPADGRRSGLSNLAARAVNVGGSFEARRGDSGGTVVEWRAPLAGA